MVLAQEARNLLAEEWEQKVVDPSDADNVARFYRESAELQYDISEWHRDEPGRRAWTDIMVQVAKDNNVKSVLDVGCGGGHDLKALFPFMEDAVGVEPNHALRELASEHVAVEPRLSDIHGTFDLTLCIDVLEHLPDPVTFIDRMTAHVPVNGLLFEATATTDTLTPLHLKSNWGWSPVGQLRGLGFEQIAQWDRLRLWKRVAASSPLHPGLLMAVWRGMENQTMNCVMAAVRRGFELMVTDNDALICRARSRVVADWWRNCHSDVFLMVDGDVVFNTEDAERLIRLCRDGHDIICGAYAVRSGAHTSCRLYPGQAVTFAPDAEPVEIQYAATGFMAVHRRVVEALFKTVPLCHAEEKWAFWPIFQPYPYQADEKAGAPYYLSEDWAFCQRAKDAGFKIWLDPSIRLGHMGLKTYTVDDIVSNGQVTVRQTEG